MSEAKSNLEIMDVLSSIRRLVSESRKPDTGGERREPVPPAVPASAPLLAEGQLPPLMPAQPTLVVPPPVELPPVEPVAGLAASARFVLTAAHRVDDPVGEADEGAAAELVDADHDAPAGLTLATEADPQDASLEDAIAELEQAVAGIKADFEGDGGDPEALAVEALPPFDPAPWRSEGGAARPISAFKGIISGFGSDDWADEALDTPVTADLPTRLPADTEAEAWRLPSLGGAGRMTPSAPRAEQASDASAVGAPAVDVTDTTPEPDPVDAVGAASVELTDPPEDVLPESDTPADLPVVDETAVEPPLAALVAGFTDAGPEAEGVAAEVELAADPDAGDEVAGATDAETGEASIVAEGAVAATPLFGRLHLGERVEGDRPATGRPVIVRATDESLQPLSLDEDDADDEFGADADLFDPLSGAAVDPEQLRDMVTEIIREELRGALGERITRNLRALVRREIERALAADR